jgi:hypothetical protein
MRFFGDMMNGWALVVWESERTQIYLSFDFREALVGWVIDHDCVAIRPLPCFAIFFEFVSRAER